MRLGANSEMTVIFFKKRLSPKQSGAAGAAGAACQQHPSHLCSCTCHPFLGHFLLSPALGYVQALPPFFLPPSLVKEM